MKIGAVAMVGMLSVGWQLRADEINSRAIHNYNYFSVGYGYLHEVADTDVNAHGAVGEFSFEKYNVLFAVTGGYFWADDTGSADINLWSVSPGVGYVVRLAENHINIIPRIAFSYSGIQIDDPVFGDESDET